MAQQCHFAVLGAWALTRVSWRWRHDLGGGGHRRWGAPVVGRGSCRHGMVGDEVRTRGDEEIGRKDEGELVGATGGDGAPAAVELEKGRGVNDFIATKGWGWLEASLRERHHVGMGHAWCASDAA
jgi:hypothetical protein